MRHTREDAQILRHRRASYDRKVLRMRMIAYGHRDFEVSSWYVKQQYKELHGDIQHDARIRARNASVLHEAA